MVASGCNSSANMPSDPSKTVLPLLLVSVVLQEKTGFKTVHVAIDQPIVEKHPNIAFSFQGNVRGLRKETRM
ncbi:uncharacterized protein UV8b_01333 [Ustilaginoidea virens]|uniref:Uncharacterized protein n=1 Tax=Ustilaginoidea virens TaxID=1159556 RepID=A0A8E5MF56_USTVR|nr:uncharacterized protein UV8b_01333 [Ustilaginoidea virens]QUC17092.1 hypothetical protein UV8b_01333 [Ustilaginoidea virens]